MDVKQFLSEQFTKIAKEYPNLYIIYEICDYSDTVFVKITPNSLYESYDFVRLLIEIEGRFSKSFNNRMDICFVSEDSSYIMSDQAKVLHTPSLFYRISFDETDREYLKNLKLVVSSRSDSGSSEKFSKGSNREEINSIMLSPTYIIGKGQFENITSKSKPIFEVELTGKENLERAA
jgi:hypothetical protein